MSSHALLPRHGRAAFVGLAAISLVAAACGSSTSTPSPSSGLATLPAFSAAPSLSSAPTFPNASAQATPSASESPGASPTGLLAECATLATGLLNPRGIAIADDGTIYVAEAGTGGTEPDYATAPVGSPAASAAASPATTGAIPSPSASTGAGATPAPVTTHGETGQITKITTDGQKTVVASGITSYNFMGDVVGPAGIVIGKDGTLYVSVGGPGPGTADFVPAGDADWVVKIDSSGTITPLADIGQYERANNPDPNAVDSNVGGMALGTDGMLYVADSGGNDLYSVDPANGNLKLVTVFPGLPSADNAPNPARGGKPEVDPVPTSVFADPKGGVYVGFLTGAALWATPGSAKVVHVTADGKTEDAVTGLNMVTGVAVTDGTIYASELSTNFVETPPAPGEIDSAETGGTPVPFLTELPFPYGIAVTPDGKSIDIVINATTAPDATPNGEVISCPLPAAPQASPTPKPTSSAPPTELAPSESPAETATPAASAPPSSAPPSTAPSVAPTSPAESLPLPSGSPSVAPSTL